MPSSLRLKNSDPPNDAFSFQERLAFNDFEALWLPRLCPSHQLMAVDLEISPFFHVTRTQLRCEGHVPGAARATET